MRWLSSIFFLFLFTVPAMAQSSLPTYLNNRNPLPNSTTTPPLTTDRFLVVRGNLGYYLPGDYFLTSRTLPDCPDLSGQHLNYSGGVWSCGTTGGTGGGGTTTTSVDCIFATATTCLGINGTDELLYR